MSGDQIHIGNPFPFYQVYEHILKREYAIKNRAEFTDIQSRLIHKMFLEEFKAFQPICQSKYGNIRETETYIPKLMFSEYGR